MSDVDRMVTELELASDQLKRLAKDGDSQEAAELVERCAQLTADLSSALGQRAREARGAPDVAGGADQETLI